MLECAWSRRLWHVKPTEAGKLLQLQLRLQLQLQLKLELQLEMMLDL